TPTAWAERLAALDARAHTVAALARALVADDPDAGTVLAWADELRATIESHTRDLDLATPPELVRRLTALARNAETMVAAMDFGFLFDPVRKLFSLGYRPADGTLDPGYYDLLASEACLTSFVAIAKGD